MLGRVTEFQAPEVGPRDLRWEGFVKSAFGMRVEIIHDQRHEVALGVSGVQQMSDFQRPLGFRAMGASGGLPPEPLIALAGASGGYRLEVTANQSGAYEISLDPARPSVAADRLYVSMLNRLCQ